MASTSFSEVDAIFVCSDDFHKLSVNFSRNVLQVRENGRIFAPSNNNKMAY